MKIRVKYKLLDTGFGLGTFYAEVVRVNDDWDDFKFLHIYKNVLLTYYITSMFRPS